MKWSAFYRYLDQESDKLEAFDIQGATFYVNRETCSVYKLWSDVLINIDHFIDDILENGLECHKTYDSIFPQAFEPLKRYLNAKKFAKKFNNLK